MGRGWPKGLKRPASTYIDRSIPQAVLDIVNASIVRAMQNVEDDLPFTAGSDPDAILLELGLPKRAPTTEPLDLPMELLHLSGPRRRKRAPKRPAA